MLFAAPFAVPFFFFPRTDFFAFLYSSCSHPILHHEFQEEVYKETARFSLKKILRLLYFLSEKTGLTVSLPLLSYLRAIQTSKNGNTLLHIRQIILRPELDALDMIERMVTDTVPTIYHHLEDLGMLTYIISYHEKGSLDPIRIQYI
jgi:hypothetical protein